MSSDKILEGYHMYFVLVDRKSLVPSLHCQFYFACWKKLLLFFQHAKRKLAVETGNEAR